MLTKVFAAAVHGIDAITITVEVNVFSGIKFHLVGLPDSAVKESQQRIESALRESGYRVPGKKIIINMAPADIRKEGAAYDLPLAIGILNASEQIKTEKISKFMLMGELSLDGDLQSVKGVLPMAIKAREEGFEGFIVPKQNAKEAAVVNNLKVYGAETISENHCRYTNRVCSTQHPTSIGFRGCKRARKCKESFGDCSSRRAQPFDDRTSRSRKNSIPVLIVRLTILFLMWHSSEEVRIRNRERFLWRIMACSLWMNCLNLNGKCWK